MIVTLASAGQIWSDSETRELQRLHDAFPKPNFEIECSHTDEGDPWCTVHDLASDRIIVHVARVDRRYILAHADGNASQSFATIETAIDTAIRSSKL